VAPVFIDCGVWDKTHSEPQAFMAETRSMSREREAP
jgi:hypothetical protein